MPTFEFTSPEGKKYSIDGPAGSTHSQAFQQLQSQLGKSAPASSTVTTPAAPAAAAGPDMSSTIGNRGIEQFLGGAIQGGVLDPIEGLGQLLGHYTGVTAPIPQSMRDYFGQVSKDVQSSTPAKIGEVAGAVGSMAVAPEAAIGTAGRVASMFGKGAKAAAPATRAGTKAATFVERVNLESARLGRQLTQEELDTILAGKALPRGSSALARTGKGAATGAIAAGVQPVQDENNFTAKKLAQVGAGATLGGAAGSGMTGAAGQLLRRHPYAAWGGAYPMYEILHGLMGHPALLATLAGLAGTHALGKMGPGAIGGVSGGLGELIGKMGSDQQPRP